MQYTWPCRAQSHRRGESSWSSEESSRRNVFHRLLQRKDHTQLFYCCPMTSFSKLGVRARLSDLFLALHERARAQSTQRLKWTTHKTTASRSTCDSHMTCSVQSHSVVWEDGFIKNAVCKCVWSVLPPPPLLRCGLCWSVKHHRLGQGGASGTGLHSGIAPLTSATCALLVKLRTALLYITSDRE